MLRLVFRCWTRGAPNGIWLHSGIQFNIQENIPIEVLLQIYQSMLSDDQSLLDLNVSHYYIHVTQPQRILEVSEQNRSSDSLSIHPAPKLPDDSLDVDRQRIEIKDIESIFQDDSANLFNSMHMEVKDFLKDNFGRSGWELIPVQLFTNYLMKEFETMFNPSDIETIRLKLLEYLKMRMGGTLIDIDKLSQITKTGLIGLVSSFMNNLDVESSPTKPATQVTDIQSIVKSFGEKLFHSLEKQLESKLNQQIAKISDKYSVVVTMLYKIAKKVDPNNSRKLKQQVKCLNERIEVLECDAKRAYQEVCLIKEQSLKLKEENLRLHEKLDKMNEQLKNQNHQMSRYQEFSHILPSPTSNSFDRGKLEQIFHMCSTPKSQKSQLTLISQHIRGRSKSSTNLDANLTCLSNRENPQQHHENPRLNTQELPTQQDERSRSRNRSAFKKNSQIICTKPRPLATVQKKKQWRI